jgi:hypothetical protein
MSKRLLPLALLLCGLLLAGGVRAGQLLDRDGDGAPDFASVGDWDGDGLLELTDVQAAVDALTDPDLKHVLVEPGVYEPPQSPARPRGLVELPSNIVFRCAGASLTVLRGLPASVTDLERAVLINDNPFGGNHDITIQDCQIDGGMPDVYDSRGWTADGRMGINLFNVSGALVAGNYVHHTHHACLYTKNSQDVRFEDNVLEDCGGYGNPRSLRMPAIYLYAFGDGVTQRVTASGNTIRRSAGSGFNTRRDDTSAAIRDVEFRDNRVDNTTASWAAAPPAKCIAIRGADGVRLLGNECAHTGSVYVAPSPSGYMGEPAEHADANRDVLIEDLVMSDVEDYRGIVIGERVDGVVLRRVQIARTPSNQPCVSWNTPLRGLLLEDVRVSGCGGTGLLQTGPGSGATAAERVRLQDVIVDGADAVTLTDSTYWHGIELQGSNDGLSLLNVTVRNASRHGLRIGSSTAPLSNSSLRQIHVDATPPGFLGRFSARDLPACDAGRNGTWAVVADATAATACGGGGETENRCRCVGGSWSDADDFPPQYGIEIAGASHQNTYSNLRLDDVGNSWGLRLAGAQQSSVVSLVSATNHSDFASLPQRGAVSVGPHADVVVRYATCHGTLAGSPCVSGLADSDADGVADGSDNCPYVPNADQADGDGAGVGNACEPRASCGLGGEIALPLGVVILLRRGRRRAGRGH